MAAASITEGALFRDRIPNQGVSGPRVACPRLPAGPEAAACRVRVARRAVQHASVAKLRSYGTGVPTFIDAANDAGCSRTRGASTLGRGTSASDLTYVDVGRPRGAFHGV